MKPDMNIDKVRHMSVWCLYVCVFSSPQNVSSEAEEGMIPDSPRRPLSLPVASKMKRRKEQIHVRYAETPLSLSREKFKMRIKTQLHCPNDYDIMHDIH